MIGATAYSPTPPGSSWWPGTSRMPSAGDRSASASTSAGVTTVWSARTPESRRDGVSSARASSAAASSSHSQPLGDLGQPAAGECDPDELVVHPGGQGQGLALLGDDGPEHLGDDLVEPH